MWNPFKKKPPVGGPTMDNRGKGDKTIRAGDLVICLGDDWTYNSSFDPKTGDLLKVTDIYEATAHYRGGLLHSFFLKFAGKPQEYGWDYAMFRKVEHDTKEADEEFKNTIKRMAPVPLLRPPSKAPAKEDA